MPPYLSVALVNDLKSNLILLVVEVVVEVAAEQADDDEDTW